MNSDRKQFLPLLLSLFLMDSQRWLRRMRYKLQWASQ